VTVNGGLPTRGTRTEIEGRMESGEAEPWTEQRLEGSGSASKHAAVTSSSSETGPTGQYVITSKPRPNRADMPPGWEWLCGADPETRARFEQRHERTP
jgi:hypothetical protein